MGILIIEITGNATRLSRVLGLAMCLLFFVSIAEHSIVSNSIHLRLMLLPKIKRMRLQMVAHARAQILLPFCAFHRSHLVLACQFLHLHVVTVTASSLTWFLQVVLLHQ